MSTTTYVFMEKKENCLDKSVNILTPANEYPQHMFSWRKRKTIYLDTSVMILTPTDEYHNICFHGEKGKLFIVILLL